MKNRTRILLLSFAGIALLMLGIFFIMEHLQGPQAYALISVDGNNVREIELHAAPDQQINACRNMGQSGAEISDHRMRFARLSRPPLHRLWLAGPSAAERRLYAQSGWQSPSTTSRPLPNKTRTPTDVCIGRRRQSGNGYPLKSSNQGKSI